MKRILFPLLTIVVVLNSCAKVEPSITLTKYAETFSYTGGVVLDTVHCNCDWAATCDVEGVTITPSTYYGDCPVVITIPEQNSKETLPVKVTFTATIDDDTATKKFVATVTSKPYIDFPQITEPVYVSSLACGVRLYLESNGEWEYEESAGNKDLTISPKSGTFNDIVSISFPANTETKEKTYDLTFRLKSDNSVKKTARYIQYSKQ